MPLIENMSAFFADFGVPVSFAGSPAGLLGNLDRVDAVVAENDGLAGVIGTTQVVLVETAPVDALRIGDAITVDGSNYTIRHRPKVDDGKITRLYLKGP